MLSVEQPFVNCTLARLTNGIRRISLIEEDVEDPNKIVVPTEEDTFENEIPPGIDAEQLSPKTGSIETTLPKMVRLR